MRAIILAGGEGTRLRPYTTTIPKPLVPVGDQAVMEIVVRQLVACGCERITVALGYRAHLVRAYFQDGQRWGARIDYSLEERPLGTVGGLRLIDDLPRHFLLLKGDILTDLDFARLFAAHCASGAVATVATYRRQVKIDFGVLRQDAESGRIVGFTEKPVNHYEVSMGVYAFSREVLRFVPADEAFGFDQLMLALIDRAQDVRAFAFSGYWLDIGRPDDYDRANTEFEQMRQRFLPREQGGEQGEDG